MCALDAALEDSSGQSWKLRPPSPPQSTCSPLVPPTYQSLPTGTPPSLSKIEALHGSYLAIALPSSAGESHGQCSTGDFSEACHRANTGVPSHEHFPATRTANAAAPASAPAGEGAEPSRSDTAGDKLWGHANAAATTALAMARRVGGLERPGGGRTRVRIGLCSGAVCGAVIGADRPRFR